MRPHGAQEAAGAAITDRADRHLEAARRDLDRVRGGLYVPGGVEIEIDRDFVDEEGQEG